MADVASAQAQAAQDQGVLDYMGNKITAGVEKTKEIGTKVVDTVSDEQWRAQQA